MRCQTILLLLWTLTAFVSCQDPEIIVKTVSDGITLSCVGNEIQGKDGPVKLLKLDYKDENAGEYTCLTANEDADYKNPSTKIFVKFRKCDNCIELDVTSILGIVVGNVVATTVIGVAVYLIASQKRATPTTPKKRPDRRPPVSNEGSSRAASDHYQPLKHRSGQKDTYDVLTSKT